MSGEEPSTSGRQLDEEDERRQQDLYITHQVSKLDTLAGLAVKYHVTVADIKRANGLLSDSAMFAKDTLLIPTRSLPVGVEYSTWAGMIVTQYGRIPGDTARSLSFGSGSPPKQSASLDMLQRYYGTGDTASEPSDFRPGDPEGYQGSANGTEIEMSEMDHLGRLERHKEARQSACPDSVEYAGSRSGNLADERLRRRRASEASASTSLQAADGDDRVVGDFLENLSGDSSISQAGGRPTGGHRRALTAAQSQHLGRRESIMERLKRVASQPALAVPQPAALSRIGEAVIGPLTESLPPLPPSSKAARERLTSSPQQRSKEARKAD